MIGGTISRMNVLIGATNTATPVIHSVIGSLGKLAIAAGAVAGITIIGKKCIDSFVSFEKVLTDSLVMFDDVEEAMRVKMAEAAKKLSTEIPRSANQCAEAYYYLGSAGLDAAVALESLPIVGEFAVATNLDMASAAQTAATVLKTYEISVSDLTHYLDMMTKAMKSALMTQEDMNEALTYVGGTAKSFGISLDEVVTCLALFADAGIKGSMAGTSLRRIIINLLAPTAENKELMEKLGLQIYDSEGKFRGLTTVINELIPILQEMTEEERNAAIEALAGARAISGFNKIVTAGTERFNELREAIENADGTIAEMADEVKKTAASKIAIFKNKINTLAMDIGELLIPAIEAFINILTPLINFLKEHKEIVVALMAVIGGLATAYITWKVATIALATAQKIATAVQWLFNTALYACPIVWSIGAIVALIVIVWLLVTNWEKIVAFLGELWENLVKAFQAVYDFFVKAIKAIIDFFIGLGKSIGDAIRGIIDWFLNLPTMIWNAIKDIGSWLLDAGAKLIGGLWEGIKSAIGNFGKWLYDNTIGAALKWLGISSPSIEFMKIGEAVGTGFQKGIDKVGIHIPLPQIGETTFAHIPTTAGTGGKTIIFSGDIHIHGVQKVDEFMDELERRFAVIR